MLFDNRKIYFIKKEFQSRFILRFVAVASVWAAATVMLFAYLAEKKLEIVRFSSHINITTTTELLLPATVGAHAVSILIFAGILAYAIHSLWKRLSPPLSTIKKHIERMTGGELTSEVILGESEEFQDLAADLNAMRKELQRNIVQIKEQHGVLSAAAAELRGSIFKGNASLSDIARLQTAVDRMKEGLQAFHY